MSHGLPEHSGRRPLAQDIAAATRSVHFKLNKLIISNLPLALPPRANNSAAYISGLLHIAPIYITFEALWEDIIRSHPDDFSEVVHPDSRDFQHKLHGFGNVSREHERLGASGVRRTCLSNQLHAALQHLYIPGLMRSERLRADLSQLTGWPQEILERQLRAVSQMGRLGEFISHIKRAVASKPQVLLSYSYIMFMALFAGGRFMRASFESAGEPFWNELPSPIKPLMHACEEKDSQSGARARRGQDGGSTAALGPSSHESHNMPLHFFHFPTALDGEDLKREFKKRLLESEDILTEKERDDVVQEAVCIFDNMLLVVRQLESTCGEPRQDDSDGEEHLEALSGLLKNPLGIRFRDSVAVAKEKRARSSSRKSSEGMDRPPPVAARQEPSSSSYAPANCSGGHPHPAMHPPIAAMANIELCPGFAKSMRFDQTLAKPARGPQNSQDSGMELADTLKMATKKVYGVHVTNWVMIAAFGAIILGVLLTGRRGVLELTSPP